MEWQPIETAPKDGETILFCQFTGLKFLPARIGTGYWNKFSGNWEWDSEGPASPSHWMPLPPPPQTEAKA